MTTEIVSMPGGQTAPTRFEPRTGQQGAAAAEQPTIDLSTLMRIAREWRWFILAGAVAGLALGLLATLLTTPRYRAGVTLEVNPPSVKILDEKDGQSFSASGYDFIATQVGLLSSRSLAERTAQDLNLVADKEVAGEGGSVSDRLAAATSWVAGGIEVQPPEDGQLIRVNFTDTNPERAARIANGLADSFIGSGLQRRIDASAYARRFLEDQIAKTRTQLETSERALVSYAQKQGIINTSTGANGASSDASSLQGESLIALNAALSEATARRVAAESAYRQASVSTAGSETSQSTQGLRQTLATLQADYQQKRATLKPDHPDMIALQGQIEEIRRQIANERSQAVGAATNTLLANYRAALTAENALRGRVAALKGSVLDLRGRSIQYTILQREVDTNRALYDALLQRYKQIGVGSEVGATPVSVVDRAQVPGGPFKPAPLFNLGLGLLIGLLGSLGIAIALEYLNDTIKTREDVRRKLAAACLGVIPKVARKGSFVDEIDDPSSPVVEAFSAVLAALRFSAQSGTPKRFLISSTQPGEGKSSSSLALARSYARRGENVLLIDADLRRPIFRGISNERGLVNILTDTLPLRECIVPTQFEGLCLLPCGPIAPNPADLLATRRFAEMLDEAETMFDRVIVDSPPFLGLADGSLLSAAVGNVVLIVEAGRIRTRNAKETIDKIQQAGARLLGVVLTKSTEETSHYGYGSYRYGQIEGDRDRMIMITEEAAE